MVLRDLTSASCAGGSSSAAAPLTSLAARLAERAGAPSHAPPPPQAPQDAEERINALIHGHRIAPPAHQAPNVQHASPMLLVQRDAMYTPRLRTPVMPPLPEPDDNAVTARFEAAYIAAAPHATPPVLQTPRPTPAIGPLPMWPAPHMFPPRPPPHMMHQPQHPYMFPAQYAAAPPAPVAQAQPAALTTQPAAQEPRASNDTLYTDIMRRLEGLGVTDADATPLNVMTEEQQSWGDEFTGLDGFHDADDDDNENESGLDSYANDLAAAGFIDPGRQNFTFEEANPFGGTPAAEALAEGERLREAGQLARALLAFEAALNRPATDPHPPLDEIARFRAWYLLGITLAECDDDTRAIQALLRVVRAYENVAATGTVEASDDEHHPVAIAAAAALALAVSYVNELDVPRATAELWRWLTLRDLRRGEQRARPFETRINDDITVVIRALEDITREAPDDAAEVQLALGVAHNGARDYPAAAVALQRAVAIRDNDARLWNRLGATLANGGRSDDALRAYRRAVDLCPLYVRAWVNVGTAYANNSDFGRAARYYLRALAMAADERAASSSNRQGQDEMGHVWGYLRSALLSLGRTELLPACDRADIEAMREHFSF